MRKDLKRVKEIVIGLSKGKVFQGRGKAGAKVLRWELSWCV